MENKFLSSGKNADLSCAAIIVAAGLGSRAAAQHDFQSKTSKHKRAPTMPKQFWQLGSKMVLGHSIDYFCAHPKIATVILVLPDGEFGHVKGSITDAKKPVHTVGGGVTRQDSVRAGLDTLNALPEYDNITHVAIHDAARPLIPSDLLDRLIHAFTSSTNPKIIGAVPILRLADSIKVIDQNAILGGIDRRQLAAAQTPQLFSREEISALHKKFATKTSFTDDCSLVEESGFQVITIDGAKKLLKLTDANDFAILEQWVAQAAEEAPVTQTSELNEMNETRHGTGFDVHRFDQGAGPIWLAGVKINNNRRVLAHSDGDVGFHALCDAIFGALADGDIGSHFPPNDPQWKNTDSAIFLNYAMGRVTKRGGRIIHLDLTFICEYPKINPHRDAMRTRIAEICRIAIDRVSVKATTSEGLGFIGRGEGIAAQASATITLPASTGTLTNRSSGTASRINETSL